MTEDALKETSPYASEVLKEDPSAPGGYRAPREGEIIKNPLLAQVFRLLVEKGKAGFYEGPVAEAIVRATTEKGGFLTLEDLKYHAAQGSEPSDPISIKLGATEASPQTSTNSVNGVELWEHPPNGQGIVAVIALGILQELERTNKIPKLSSLEHNSTKYDLEFPALLKGYLSLSLPR